MSNRNPKNKFTKGNKAAAVNKGKQKRGTVVKQLLEDAVRLGTQYGSVVQFRELVYLGYYHGLTHPNKEVRINTAIKLGDYIDPKKKIVDAGDGIQKILEVQRPMEMILKGQMQLGFDPKTTPDLKKLQSIIDKLKKEKQKKKESNSGD